MKKISIFRLFTFAVFVSLFIPALVQDGMFLDGVTYSAISKNMANGIGSYWNPHYTKTLEPEFHAHPPLVFIIQSFFFKLLGNGFLTERIFNLFVLILTISGITLSWRLFTNRDELKDFAWLPVLLWLTIPLVSWSFKNNLLENTMGVFNIFSVFFILKSLLERRVIYLSAASILIVLAFFSKGPAGLFPLIVPVFYAIVFQRPEKNLLYSVSLLLMTIAVSCIFLFAFPEVKNNITAYYHHQIIPSLITQKDITTEYRFSIILVLIRELSIPIIILLFFTIRQWATIRNLSFLKNKTAILFLLIAFSASLPLMVSLKQRDFYLIPSMPFFILSIGFLLAPFLKSVVDKLSNSNLRLIKWLSLASIFSVVVFSTFQYGKFSRDTEKLTDIYAISQVVPEGTIISTSKNLCSDWSLVAYMSRIGYLSLDYENKHQYYLAENDSMIDNQVLENYKEMDLKLNKYVLFEIK
jgi:hypothetical protein